MTQPEMRFFALERLRGLYARPRAWTMTREAYVVQVILLLELLDTSILPNKLHDLHVKTFRIPGTLAADPNTLAAAIDDGWARAFLDEALQLAGQQLNREFVMHERTGS